MKPLIKSAEMGGSPMILFGQGTPTDQKKSREISESPSRESGKAVESSASALIVQNVSTLNESFLPEADIAASEDSIDLPQIMADLTETILQSKKQEFEFAKLAAEKEGYATGYEQGIKDAQQTQHEAVLKLAQTIEDAQVRITEQLQDINELVADIIFEAVCKIVGPRATDMATCESVLRNIVEAHRSEHILNIRVHPTHFKMLRDLGNDRGANETDYPLLTRLPLIEDIAVELGGCIVELKSGHIDASIQTQMKNFANSIRNHLSVRATS